MNLLLGSALAPSTISVYTRSWQLFKEFSSNSYIIYKGTNDLPLHPNKVALFISYLHLRGFAPTSIITYTSALGYAHKILNIQDPVQTTLIQKLLASACKISPSIDTRLPITKLILLNLVDSVNHMSISHYNRLLLEAMFVIAFYGLMRIGEITTTTTNKTVLNLKQITISQNFVKIKISKFKHNKDGQEREILLPKQDQIQICPISTLTNYLLEKTIINNYSYSTIITQSLETISLINSNLV
jgi:hypothetical protein